MLKKRVGGEYRKEREKGDKKRIDYWIMGRVPKILSGVEKSNFCRNILSCVFREKRQRVMYINFRGPGPPLGTRKCASLVGVHHLVGIFLKIPNT